MPIPSTSKDLRQQGNQHFRSFDYEKAKQLYLESLSIALESSQRNSGKKETSNVVDEMDEEEREHFAAILSNLAASRIHSFEYDLALLNVEAARTIRPEFSRAKAREGEVWTGLQDFERAKEAYESALELAEDGPTRTRYIAALNTIEQSLLSSQKDSIHPSLTAAEQSLSFASRYDRFVTNGGNAEEVGVSANCAVFSWTMMDKALEVLDEKLKVLDSGQVESESPSPVLEIADAIVTDSRGFHIPSGKDHELPLTTKLRLQLSWDSQVLDLEKFLKPNTVPKDVIDEFDRSVEKDGWTKVKVALAHLIRGSFVAAFINEIQSRTLEACSQYRFVLGLIQEGNERWKDAGEETIGSTFRFTFARKVKMHLLESLVDGHFRSTTDDERSQYPMAEIQGLAEELMDDCREQKAPSDEISTFAFQVQPIVAAGKAFAYSLRERARQEENRIDFPVGYWLHPGMMKACAKLYSTAGAVLPDDDPEKAINLFNALAFDLRGGGMSIQTLFERAGEAEAAFVPSERIFGTASRRFDSRTLVRTACDTARSHLTTFLPFIDDSILSTTTLKPVATVVASELSNPSGKTVDSWQECVAEEILRALEGDLAVAEQM